jgi:predicted ATPase/DNA-binding SARP family transcriptional activator
MSITPPSGVRVTYRQQYRRCGKPTCARCASGGPGHGPYWYAVWWDGRRTRSQYLGKAPPSPSEMPASLVLPAPSPDALAAEAVPTLRVRTLGGFAVWREGNPLALGGWGAQRAGELFKWLLGTANHRLTREQAIDRLWPETSAETAAVNLRVLVHRLRRALGEASGIAESVLHYDGRSLALAPGEPAPWLDADAFAQAAATALATHSAGLCRMALAYYQGEYLPEDPYEEWAIARREELRLLHLKLLLHLADCALRIGEGEEAAGCFQTILAADSSNEEAAVGLMRLRIAAAQPAAALRVYYRLVEALREELGLRPGTEARNLATSLAPRRSAPPAPLAPLPPHNLPAVSVDLIGRGRDLSALTAHLTSESARHSCRLLTLVGPGGIGKTRLALALAEEVLEQCPEGVWLVDLSGLPAGMAGDDPTVARAVAAVLNVREAPGPSILSTLIDALRGRRLLLLLDNCEHVLAPVAEVAAALLAGCPMLRILATSRETLGVAGEQPWAVPALSLPSAAADLEQMADAAAVRLFLARSRMQRPGLELTAENAAAIAVICRGLDGLPLALELAAARAGVFSVSEIASRLQESVLLLTGGARGAPPRQRTLHATLDWSYALLTEPEQQLLRRLAVFVGGCALEAVQAVVQAVGSRQGDDPAETGEWATVDGLQGLARKSLLLCEVEGESTRYRLLETVRHYASALPTSAAESVAARNAHLHYYLDLAEAADRELRGPTQSTWLVKLDREHDNLRAALRWATRHGQWRTGLRLATALGRFWYLHGYLSEGQDWLEGLLAQTGALGAGDHEEDMRLRGMALRAAGVLASDQGDYARAAAWYEEGVALLRAIGDTRNLALTLNNLGNVVGWQGDFLGAQRLFEESLALLRRVGDKGLIAALLGSLGGLAIDQGDTERAQPLVEESLTLQRELGDKDGSARSLNNLALIAHMGGDVPHAVALYEESLAIKRALGSKSSIAYSLCSLAAVYCELGDFPRATALQRESMTLRLAVNDRRGMMSCLEGMADIAYGEGQAVGATRLFGAASAIRRQIGAEKPEAERRSQETVVSALRAALGDSAFTRAWDGGAALPLADAVAEALASHQPPASGRLVEL